MTRPIRGMTLLLALLFVSLLVQVTRVQVVNARHLQTDNGNIRPIIQQYGQRARCHPGRGDAGRALRRHRRRAVALRAPLPAGLAYAPATGLLLPRLRRDGHRAGRRPDPVGHGHPTAGQPVLGPAARAGRARAASVLLTLNAAAQRAAYQGLKKYRGAVVAIEPSTGRILALATSPSFDPNLLSANDTKVEHGGLGPGYTADPNQPLLNRPLAKTTRQVRRSRS